MKYINSLKYMNSFETAKSPSDLSQKRISELCALLGKVNLGANGIYLPRGTASHATAVMLESVIRQAGYTVGRISGVFGADSRSIVYINGEAASIEDYNLAVAEVKSAVQSSPENEYRNQETAFAMALLICKMNACDRVIFEGSTWGDQDISSVCAPYDLVIVPSGCSDEDGALSPLCNAIKRGVREVISGTQKKTVYDRISKACFTSGVRLTLTSKTGFRTDGVSGIERRFTYGERSGYCVKSPSKLLCDPAMLVIESALAIRRDGIKMPWTSIMSGLMNARDTGCFNILSISPLLLTDSAETENEVRLLLSTLDEVLSYRKRLTVCIPKAEERMLDLFSDIGSLSVIAVGEHVESENKGRVTYSSCEDAARSIIALMKAQEDIVCFGSVAFEREIRTELLKIMNNG